MFKINKNIKPLLGLVIPHWRFMLLGALFGIATILANIGLLGTSAVLIAGAALMPPILDLMVLIVGVRFFGISRGVFRYAERYFTHDLTFRILSELRVWFYCRLEPLVPLGLKGKNSGQLLNRMVTDVDTLKFFYLRVVAVPLVAVLVFPITGVFLWQFSPPAVGVFAVFYLLAGLVLPLLVRRACKGWAVAASQKRDGLYGKLVEYIYGLADLLCYGKEAGAAKSILLLQGQLMEQEAKVAALHNLSGVGVSFLANCALVLSLILTIPLVSGGQLDGIYLAMVVLVVWASFEAVLPMPAVMEESSKCLVAADNLFEIINAKPQAKSSSQNKFQDKNPAVVELPNYNLQVDQLSYGYDPEKPVLHDLSFSLPQGEKLAIVGASGSGKSTLLSLLFGFGKPQQGKISLGGYDLSTLPESLIHQSFGYVEQRPYLFNTTIRENLLLAKTWATAAELEAACEKAQLGAFIQSLPKGYETVVGMNGLRLSGGQRQRLALARLFLQNPPIIILDEITQGLDSLTVSQVFGAINAFCTEKGGEKTLIYVTHSLFGLAEMGKILVLEQGRLTEQGTQSQLLAADGYYSKLWRLEHEIF